MHTTVEQTEIDSRTLLTTVRVINQNGSEEVRCSTHPRVDLRLEAPTRFAFGKNLRRVTVSMSQKEIDYRVALDAIRTA